MPDSAFVNESLLLQEIMSMDRVQKSLSYTTVHLSHRNEVLLKSVIALYNLRNRVTWRYRQSSRADLVVVGDNLEGVDLDREILSRLTPRQVVLSLGSRIRATSERMLYVEPPLRAGDVVKQIEQAEAYLQRVLSESADGGFDSDEEADLRLHDKVRLLRWPSAELLREHWDFIRLATMMTHRSMSAADLTRRSKQPEALCQHFIQVVLGSGCAEYVNEARPDEEKAPDSRLKGLFSKIRMKLGLFNSEMHS